MRCGMDSLKACFCIQWRKFKRAATDTHGFMQRGHRSEPKFKRARISQPGLRPQPNYEGHPEIRIMPTDSVAIPRIKTNSHGECPEPRIRGIATPSVGMSLVVSFETN